MQHDITDLRVTKTVRSIKYAFCELIIEKNYSDISVTELANRAEINRKTFYLHYPTLESLAKEFIDDITEGYLEYASYEIEQQDISGCIAKFYHYLDESDDVTKKLLSDTYFYDAVATKLLESEPFISLYAEKKHPYVIRAYCTSITAIYRNWIAVGRITPLDELIEYACDIVLNGYVHADL